MLLRLFFLLVFVPLLEMAILLMLADHLGFLPTFAMVLVSGFLGAVLLRRQGLQAIGRIRSELSQGRLPAAELLDGVLIVVAAAFLLTPGILTDACGMFLLIPQTRSLFRKGLVHWFKSRWRLQTFTSTGGTPEPASRPYVIDSYVVDNDESDPT